MGKIFYMMGKSSSGKDRIFRELLNKKELGLKKIVVYTTRPIRSDETDGVQYHFVEEEQLKSLQQEGKVIELRAYHTVFGVWKYFTVDDGNLDLRESSYLAIGTLESYQKLKKYYGEEMLTPLYIETEDGIRLARALERERKQEKPKYAEMCRRFLADAEDFSEGRIEEAKISHRFFNNGELEECIYDIEKYILKKI